MSTASVSRRAATVAALSGLAALAVLAAGCEPRDATSANPATTEVAEVGSLGVATPTGGPTIYADPTPTLVAPTLTAPTLVAPTRVAGPTRISPTYPATAQAYAEAVLEAWAGTDPNWLDALTTVAVSFEIFDLNASPYDEWAFLRCDGAAGSSYCSFVNADDGDVLIVQISNGLVGGPHAAVGVQLDKTVYPGDAVLYVKEFVQAWQFGNTVRMLLLSSPSVVDEVPAAPTGILTYPAPTCCGGGLTQVKVQWSGKTARFDVGTTLLGGPNAILDYAPEFGLTL
jgi:hypothetical protein